ncbi:MAG: hypothetical protein A2V77_01770 [Anaeromyxobacter sp. RBG_16_69_14]|nr:MAG: hypothetical protein A2V77_01770 [Anaeromyxobacter sp. RBG_16_69_14]HJW76746.1 sigma-70 family RNA polymerase sigma factor [Thermoleophilia bacterium]
MRCEPARPSHQALFEEIYRRELGAVRNFVRRLGTSSLYADDLAHDVILTAYERFDRFDWARPARPWLLGIAVRRHWTFAQRAEIRRVSRQDLSWVEDEATPPDEALARHEERALLRRALDALEFDRRVIFVMHEMEECTAPEIAEVLSIPVNTVYSRLGRARAEVGRLIRALCNTN